MEFHILNGISQLWLNSTTMTGFHKYDWISQLWLNFMAMIWVGSLKLDILVHHHHQLAGVSSNHPIHVKASVFCNRLPFNLSHSCNVVKWEMFVEVWPFFCLNPKVLWGFSLENTTRPVLPSGLTRKGLCLWTTFRAVLITQLQLTVN